MPARRPDRFLVGLGVLSLFSEVAEERPLLCVVDDAQWLDQASALTLAFVARRLLAEPVGIVFAAREPGEELGHQPELEVRGFATATRGPCWARRCGSNWMSESATGSSPRHGAIRSALLELPRGLTATQLAGGFGLIGGQALTGKIEQSFVRRLEALEEGARLLLLLAAAEPTGDPLLLWRAAERLGIGPGAAEARRRPGCWRSVSG